MTDAPRPPGRGVKIYDRPSLVRRLLPRLLLSLVLMVLSGLGSWWLYTRVF